MFHVYISVVYYLITLIILGIDTRAFSSLFIFMSYFSSFKFLNLFLLDYIFRFFICFLSSSSINICDDHFLYWYHHKSDRQIWIMMKVRNMIKIGKWLLFIGTKTHTISPTNNSINARKAHFQLLTNYYLLLLIGFVDW